MKRGLRVAVSALLFVSIPSFPQDERIPVFVKPKRPSIHSRHLPTLIELAVEHSPNVLKAKNALEIAELDYKNAYYKLFPSINLETKFGAIGNDPRTRTVPWHSELALSLNHVIFDQDNNLNFNRLGIARQKLERAKLEYEFLRDEQLLKVGHAYIDWSMSLELREIDENKRDLLRRQYNVLESQYKQGLKTKRDVLRIETEIKRLEIDILRRDNEVDLNYQKLASHVGMTTKELDAYDIEGEEAKPFAIMKGESPELKISDHRRSRIFKAREKEMSYETKLAERNYWPRVSLESEVKYFNHDFVDTPTTWKETETLTWQSMIVFRYNIWDFGVRKRDWQMARIRERNVADENQQVLNELAVELRDVYLKLKEFREVVRATRELLVLEQQSYSILEAEYRNGRAAYLDLITNLNSLIDARSRFLSSYFDYKRHQMRYSFHKGDLYEDLTKK